ncbi:MAG TPA: bifunctional adenosylcobinamide kinase/adenosylcobinamide-phosphate guanylyltransferase [Oceanospirillaceae bacterium]|nr:bifunctional adenosylcobinamide kinase/adenosylcobinamide-phosphate guanylyltransferase [Oceanospirillaceae bacterium]
MTSPQPLRHLYLGGARSGKSVLAENAAHSWLQSNPNGQVVYIATAQVWDKEMQVRVSQHQQRRPEHWQLVEEPMQLAEVLTSYRHAAQPTCVLVDCLTLWLTNQLCQQVDDDTDAEVVAQQAVHELAEVVENYSGQLLLVSNEVGSGIVPMGELSRQFQDLSGLMNQLLARACDKATLVVAGLPLVLK